MACYVKDLFSWNKCLENADIGIFGKFLVKSRSYQFAESQAYLGLTVFRLGGGGGGTMCPPYRFLPCSARKVCSRLMKLSDF